MPDQSYLGWPFFAEEHRALAADLDGWAEEAARTGDEGDDVDAVCVRWIRSLGEAGWLRLAVPAPYGSRSVRLDVRSLSLARETLA
ncbi:MAG: acyl-CoA dehydrogenase, partial [Gemmatimonadota bacterium]|nr:acyl-CoA dehydrogenase [Gemmatimonadota bacterium]MDQ3605420.1 acyl-CoA dehydrogenase [Gemmatimonadota bacterium]